MLADVGLGFVFLLAGYEVDLRLFGEDAGRRAVLGWFVSLALAVAVVGLLAATGLVRAFVPVALGLTTTALGTLLPVLREHGFLTGRLGRYLLAAGGVGELFPVLAIALFLGTQNRFTALASLAAVAVLAVLLGLARRTVREGGRLATVVAPGQHSTAQITLRATILLLITLIAVTDEFHLDAVLGAFLAGVVLRRWVGRRPGLEQARRRRLRLLHPDLLRLLGDEPGPGRDRGGAAAGGPVLRADARRPRAAGPAGLPRCAARRASACRRR